MARTNNYFDIAERPLFGVVFAKVNALLTLVRLHPEFAQQVV